MYYPARWDRFFQDFMTLTGIYPGPTLHFGFHRRQFTLTSAAWPAGC
jgi:hypothetical protein